MTLKLKGNELGWILKLAENHYMSTAFQDYIKKYNLDELNQFLKLLLCRFHPNNFNAGHNQTIWILTKDDSSGDSV